tara:strand:+ start:268 stop:459 length:192 start_codon:yes stop_codon:yes gene_type:complete
VVEVQVPTLEDILQPQVQVDLVVEELVHQAVLEVMLQLTQDLVVEVVEVPEVLMVLVVKVDQV